MYNTSCSIDGPVAKHCVGQGDPGDCFYIILEGEAVVYQNTPTGTRKVNHLFKADFFGERALLTDEPRCAFSAAACGKRAAC